MLRRSLISSHSKSYMNDTSMTFNGVDEYIATRYMPPVSSGVTLAIWIKMRDFTDEQIMGCGGSKRFWIGFHGTNIDIGVQDSSKDSVNVADYVKLNQWHHLVLTADGGSAKVYIDGVERDTMSYTESSESDPDEGFHIAALNGNNTSGDQRGSPMNCVINEVAIYERDFTSGEVQGLYNNGDPFWHSDASLAVWWRMGNGADNDRVLDDGDYSNQATTPPVWDLDASVASGDTTHQWERQHALNVLGNNSNVYRTGYVSGGSAKGAKIALSDAKDLSANLNLGQVYNIKMKTKRTGIMAGDSTTEVTVVDGHGTFPFTYVAKEGPVALDSDFEERNVYFIAESTTAALLSFKNIKLGETVDFDNITIHEYKGYKGLPMNMDNSNFIKDRP